MAETAPSVSYRLSASTLNNMKEAAGNYMPNYGNWRFRVKPPEEEEDTKKKTGEDSEEWGKGATEGELGKVINTGRPNMSDEKWAEYLANETPEQKQARYKREVVSGRREPSTGGTDSTLGGVNSTFDINTETGEHENVQETYWGEPRPEDEDTPLEKRSPYKALGGVGSSAPPEAGLEVLEQEVDPYKELMGAASNFRGATSENHDRIKQIVKEMKGNFTNGDKDVQAEQHVDLAKLSQVTKDEVGEGGLAHTIKEVIDEKLLSDSTRPEEMELISRFLDRKGVQNKQTEDKEWILTIPTRNGGEIPMSVDEMGELVAKRTIQYPVGQEFKTALGDFEALGRQGGEWHPEDIKMQNRTLIKNSDTLAGLVLDAGIFGTRPLIEKIQEVYFPDADIDLKELVYQSSQSKETYDEMVEMFAGGLERVAYERYAVGKNKHDEENGDLDAQSILDKYSKSDSPQEDSIA